MKLRDGTPVTNYLLKAEVTAHADRLQSKVQFDSKGLIEEIDRDPNFAEEDETGLRHVTEALANDEFKRKLCAGLRTRSSDLKSLISPLVKILLPVSSVTGVASSAVGLQFAVGALPLTIVGTSLLAVMLARFGIDYYCHDTK